MELISNEKIQELSMKLRMIPHLKLDVVNDVDKMKAEYSFISNKYGFEGYNAKEPTLKEYYKERWTGISLTSEDSNDVYKELMVRDPSNDWTDFTDTPVLDNCPYIKECITKVGGNGNRARILRVAPKSTIGWHSHFIDYEKPENILIMQMPIIMPKEFYYYVMEFRTYKMGNFHGKPDMHICNYPEGTSWIFNSFHYHNVFNYDETETRVTLEFHVNLAHPTTYDLVNDAVENYKGRLIR